MPWKISLHIQGDSFKPSQVDYDFFYQIDVGEVGIHGRYKNQPTPYGRAEIFLPAGDGRQIEALCEVGLRLMPLLKIAGATNFVIQVLRDYEQQCNEELSPREIAIMADLGCTFCYSAYQSE